MSFAKKLKSLLWRGKLDRELDEEMHFHVEQRTQDNIASGMSPRDTREAALRAFGGIAKMTERCRESRGVHFIESLAQDFRYALRTLSKDRRFALLAILALALGIGAATAIFSTLQGVERNLVPYKNPSRLVEFAIHRTGDHPSYDDYSLFSLSEFMDFREQNHVFDDMYAFFLAGGNCRVGKTSIPVGFVFVTPNAFALMGIPPAMGVLPPMTNLADPPPVLAISHQMWLNQFGGDPGILGATLTCTGNNGLEALGPPLNDVPRKLVAVMAARAPFSNGNGTMWIPFPLDRGALSAMPFLAGRLYVMGRLKPGVSVRTAQADLDVIAHHIAPNYPGRYPKQFRVAATSVIGQDYVKAVALPFAVIVVIVLVIACSNVANLLLSRATVRDREMALRASIGASRARLVRQLLVESSVLAAAGCVAACFFAWLGLTGLVRFLPVVLVPEPSLARLSALALLFALCVSLLCIFLCGFSPALRAVRGELQSRLAGDGGATTTGASGGKLRGALVIGQISLSIVLLVSTGVMLHIVLETMSADLGFNPKNLLGANLPADYATAGRRTMLPELMRRVSLLPGVRSVAVASLPPGNPLYRELVGIGASSITVSGVPPHSQTWFSGVCGVSDSYFQTIGIHLLRGRPVTADDVSSARLVAVVNQAFAQKFFGKTDPLGHTVRFDSEETAHQISDGAQFEIVGIASNTTGPEINGLAFLPEVVPAPPEALIPYTAMKSSSLDLYARTAVPPSSLERSVRQQVRAVDLDAPFTLVYDVSEGIHLTMHTFTDFYLTILGAFAGIGLLLALVGLFSVMAYTVLLRTREIGIRMAFGAQRADVLRMVLAKGALLIAIGLAIGLFASFALTRLIGTRIPRGKFGGVLITDPWTFAGVLILIVGTGFAACYFPARHAAQVDPLVALRHE